MRATIFPITAAAPIRIAIVARPRGNDWLCDEIRALSQEGIEVLVSMLTNEEAHELGLSSESLKCETAGISFLNLAVPDRSVPLDKDVFLNGVEQLEELARQGRYLAVHCRAGIGRSSMLAASILVRLGWEASQAFDAIESARGCSVPDTPEQRLWVASNVHKTSG